MKVRLHLEGTSPMLMHSSRGVDPLDPLVRQIKTITGKRKKTDDDLAVIARLEYEISLYYHPELGPVVPGSNIEKCLVEGGRITKQGKNIERAVFVTDLEAPLLYTGPRDIDGLWDAPEFRSMMAVGVGGRKIMRCRPLFNEWALAVDASVDTAVLNVAELRNIANDAGGMVGLGDFRPRYGRFSCQIEEL